MNATDTFTRIYQNDEWEGGSGWGSEPEFNKPYVQFLQHFLADYKIKSVLDIGCGDWQFSKLIDWTGIDYIGIDCVMSVVSHNQSRHGRYYFNRPSIVFRCLDALVDKLPPANLVILKDVWQHWPNRQILDFLPKLRDYPNVLITNCYAETNGDTELGGFRPLNINAKPFNLPARRLLKFGSKSVSLWHPNRSK